MACLEGGDGLAAGVTFRLRPGNDGEEVRGRERETSRKKEGQAGMHQPPGLRLVFGRTRTTRHSCHGERFGGSSKTFT